MMTPNRTFTDTQDRQWRITIGLATARRIKELSDGKIDFVDTSRVQSARNALIEMSEDVELCGRVLWWLCEAQAIELHVSENEFADAFNLDTLEQAQTAVSEAIIDFFPSRARPALQQAVAIAREVFDQETQELTQQTNELVSSPEFRTMIESAIRGNLSGNSPDLRAADPLISGVPIPSSLSANST